MFKSTSVQVRPAAIYHSVKMRARQTAELIAVALGGELMAEETTGLAPMDSVARMSDRISEEERDLMLVGHLPFMNRLGSLLVAGSVGAQAFDIPTGGMLALVRHGGSTTDPAWSLSFMLTPALLTG